MEELHVFFSGRVQGVFFRANTMNIAEAKNIKGWVKNLPDGRVEAVFQGDAIDTIVDSVIDGQNMARVDSVETELREASSDHERFSIT